MWGLADILNISQIVSVAYQEKTVLSPYFSHFFLFQLVNIGIELKWLDERVNWSITIFMFNQAVAKQEEGNGPAHKPPENSQMSFLNFLYRLNKQDIKCSGKQWQPLFFIN